MKKKMIGVLALFAVFAASASAQTLYPENGAKDAFYDGSLSVTFAEEAKISSDTKVEILDENGNTVDVISAADEKQFFQDGSEVAVGSQLILKNKNTVLITPHNYKIEPGKTYSVKYPGISEWTFSTKAKVEPKETITVDGSRTLDNKADFLSIQAALDSVATKEGTYTISLAPGLYYELLHYQGTANIILQGPKNNKRGDNCTIEYINCNDLNSSQQTRVSFFFNGADLTLENVTLINAADGEAVYSSAVKYASGNAQAETIYFRSGSGHKLAAYNSSFKGHQDTMQVSGKCWFYNCYIEGDVDFIWGTADVALFEECDIYCLRYVKDRAYIFETRVGSADNPIVPKGFVLYNSNVEVAKKQTAFYARRATAVEKSKTPYYDQCAIVNVKFKGEGDFSEMRWYVGKPPRETAFPSHVGWKEYNVTFKELKGKKPANTEKRYKSAADIDKKTYKEEYSSRDLIMNRVFNTETKKYQADESAAWDINSYARERGYTVKNLPKAKK